MVDILLFCYSRNGDADMCDSIFHNSCTHESELQAAAVQQDASRFSRDSWSYRQVVLAKTVGCVTGSSASETAAIAEPYCDPTG
jgi:hypothetical protein